MSYRFRNKLSKPMLSALLEFGHDLAPAVLWKADRLADPGGEVSTDHLEGALAAFLEDSSSVEKAYLESIEQFASCQIFEAAAWSVPYGTG